MNIMKETLTQLIQRAEKLKEEVEKLESLEFDYHTLCKISDYTIVQDQKELVEFLTLKLKNTVRLLGE
ncbi:hypothetical protein BS46_gp132 [Acinetobacter phage BS46]|nr:hypothetical protein BS46_gp132 [Acinetobacter phage BS46]